MKIFLIFLLLFSESFFVSQVFANATTPVDATINLSICGNNIAEGSEDCDNTDVRGKTCAGLGYGGGILTCDISCSFDTSNCIPITPTPTSISGSQDTEPTAALMSKIAPTISALPEDNSLLNTLLEPIRSFPQGLLFFGASSHSGAIGKNQVYTSVKSWVGEWQQFLTAVHIQNGQVLGAQTAQKCDLNNDHICDVVDLSVMLYYVQP